MSTKSVEQHDVPLQSFRPKRPANPHSTVAAAIKTPVSAPELSNPGERSAPSRAGDAAAGLVNNGREDTFLLMPNERVKIIMRFTDFTGTYAYQCHMLEHAADGLMRNYRVMA